MSRTGTNVSGRNSIERLLRLRPLQLQEAVEAFLAEPDSRLADHEVAKILQQVEQKRWLAENVWSFGDDPLTLWMNQVDDCQTELAVLEMVGDSLDLSWSFVVKTPGADELPEPRRLGAWIARAQDAAMSLFSPQAVIAPTWGMG